MNEGTYLRLGDPHRCRTPRPAIRGFEHDTYDPPGTIWRCDECGQCWLAERHLWTTYRRMDDRETRKVMRCRDVEPCEPEPT